MPDTAAGDGGAPRAAYDALRSAAVAVDPRRDVVRASGPDATAFLQGQLSQDVAALRSGASAWSWLLQPAGKVEALVRATRLDGDAWLLDTDRGWGERVLARLNRFKLRTKVDLELMDDWTVVGLRGPDLQRGDGVPEWLKSASATPGVVAAVDASWPGLPGVDLIGPGPAAPAGIAALDADGWEAARIETGIPVMGAELNERTIPAETGLVDRTVSFTKGCYTGQELVARIDSRGSNVPRLLRGVRLDGRVEPGAALRRPDGSDAAVVTSVARSPVSGWVALAYARRGVEPGMTVSADGGVEGRVDALPLVGSGTPSA
ncbi:hypothetical protein K6U06_04565 [Acidiferrimicrobium sp. IK]|uniref:CAF17-like 4Fe-4S cluster assembly/insertion protein YgfZ n=1 Tax=Acidiferrimicrobium sp. IK TaxID=2871700 RepID=UPI0021CB5D4A|nr:hypothetical protein [Acidiferrimicrobium sp. IK]MCU4183621.1 hypothetical protein [Acidiferrimicrobium sp. IK]